MTKTYLLIDLENRQPVPKDVAAWMGEVGEAWIFFAEQQKRPGKNSLDFHLVLYLGYLVVKRKKASAQSTTPLR